MADGGEQVSRALAIMDQFYVSMMESGVLKVLAFQYECFSEITEDTYLKFLTNFSSLATAVKVLNDEIFTPTERVDVACQTAKVSLPGYTPPITPFPIAVHKVSLANIIPPDNAVKVQKGKSSSTKREPMVCDYCDQKFTTLENFEIHIRQIHGEQFTRSFFSCEICEQHFLSSETLYEHMAYAHKLKEDDIESGDQLCGYCAEMTSTWEEMVEHCIEKHNAYMCTTCHIMCDTQNKLEQHIKATHLTGVKPDFIAALPPDLPQPASRFSAMKNVILDKTTVVASGAPRKRGRPRKTIPSPNYFAQMEITCNICNLTFPTDESLKQHVFKRHDPQESDLICRKCDLKFRRRKAMENHMRIVHKKFDASESEEEVVIGSAPVPVPEIEMLAPVVEQKPIVNTPIAPKTGTSIRTAKQVSVARSGRLHCEVCGELCSKAEDQEIHKDHHATRKKDRFLCLYCKAPSMTQHELRTHIVSEHRYRCIFCSLTFWWKTNLESHLKQLHSSKEECPKCFTQGVGEQLRQHVLQQHTPRKLYICKSCDTEYYTVKDMHEHEMTHAKKNKDGLTCDLCERTFFTRNRLKGHLLRHLHGSYCCYLCGQQCQTQEQLQDHIGRHRKSQFACFCGQRFVKKAGLQAHQRSNICKQGVSTTPKADIFVEVCVPKEEEDFGDVTSIFNTTKLDPLSENDESRNNIWQINIALPAETQGHMSRDFLTALAHSVKGKEDSELLASGSQPILILNASSDSQEEAIIDEQPAQIVQWMQDQGVTIVESDNAEKV